MGLIFEGIRYEKVRVRGADLCRAREYAGLSQRGLAAQLRVHGVGISRQMISLYETKAAVTVPVAFLAVLEEITDCHFASAACGQVLDGGANGGKMPV